MIVLIINNKEAFFYIQGYRNNEVDANVTKHVRKLKQEVSILNKIMDRIRAETRASYIRVLPD